MNDFPEFPEGVQRAFRDYREALPDPEPSAGFTPALWQKIEARRRTAGSLAMFRRLAQTYVGFAVTAAIILGVFVIPQLQDRAELQTASYAEVVANDDAQQEVAQAFTLPVAYEAVPPSDEVPE
jgi:hypothetical protein